MGAQFLIDTGARAWPDVKRISISSRHQATSILAHSQAFLPRSQQRTDPPSSFPCFGQRFEVHRRSRRRRLRWRLRGEESSQHGSPSHVVCSSSLAVRRLNRSAIRPAGILPTNALRNSAIVIGAKSRCAMTQRSTHPSRNAETINPI